MGLLIRNFHQYISTLVVKIDLSYARSFAFHFISINMAIRFFVR